MAADDGQGNATATDLRRLAPSEAGGLTQIEARRKMITASARAVALLCPNPDPLRIVHRHCRSPYPLKYV
jgi:hypothetical protein